MDRTYWRRQAADTPLFPDLLWSRPENKQNAGKLLLAGGNAYGFAAVAAAFAKATQAGIGTARVLLPDSLHKTVGKFFLDAEFAPSTPSGSFAQAGLSDFLAVSSWADGVLLAGEIGRNSETAILLEKFITKYRGQLTVTRDAVDYFTTTPLSLLNRQETCLVISFAQLQKIGMHAHFTTAFTFDMDFIHLVEGLHEFSKRYASNIIVKHLDTIFVATAGQVSTTKLKTDLEVWRVQTAAAASVWWLQNPTKPFEALTTALVESKH